jgi:sugar/nucleoside kinase (ribokinase family)
MSATVRLLRERRSKAFEVICAGDPQWRLLRDPHEVSLSGVSFRSRVVEVAALLAGRRIRVGVATVLDDDTFGRRSLERIAAMGADVGGVVLGSPGSRLVVVDRGGGQSGVLAEREPERGLEVPSGWSSRVLLLSGLSPVTSAAAALCKAARKARREGSTVVVDFNAGVRLWAGRDPRTTFMVLREADVVRCDFGDLVAVGVDPATVRNAMRASATLVVNDTRGATATGLFGEVQCAPRDGDMLGAEPAGEVFTAAICAELARPHTTAESPPGRWHRVLREAASTTA